MNLLISRFNLLLNPENPAGFGIQVTTHVSGIVTKQVKLINYIFSLIISLKKVYKHYVVTQSSKFAAE